VKRFEKAVRCIYDIKFEMLQVRKNEIPQCKCSGGSAQLRTLERTMATGESARFENNDSEPVAYAENLHGGWVRSMAYVGHLYLVCAVCDVTT